jgi:hypothetical protein
VIVAIGPSVGAARRATDRIPIVAVGTDGFVEGGGAASLARPGRNLTGLSGEVGVAVNGKRLQLLRKLFRRCHGWPFSEKAADRATTGVVPLLCCRTAAPAHTCSSIIRRLRRGR